MTHSVTLPGRMLAIVCVYNNLGPNLVDIFMRLNQVVIYMKNILICVLSL